MNELRDLNELMARNKALSVTGDRLVGIGLGSAPSILRKAAVAGIGRADVPFINDPDADPLVAVLRRQNVPGGFLEHGAIDVPVNQLVPTGIADPVPAWIPAEGGAIPLAHWTSSTTYTTPSGFGVMVAMSRDILRIGGARARNYVLARSMRGLIRGDNSMIDDTAASAARPAGLLWNRASVGGGSPEAELREAMEQAYAEVSNGEAVRPVWVLSGRGSLNLQGTGLVAFKDLTLTGGRIAGAPVIIAPEAGPNLILVDAAQIAISDGGLEVAVSENASVQMDDSPTMSSVTPTAVNVVSAFQTNTAVLKFTRFLSWALLREDAVAFIELPIGGSPA